VRKPEWEAGTYQVHFRPNLNSAIQWEERVGSWPNTNWVGDSVKASIKRGQAFRVWVGLDWDISDVDLRRRHVALNVGTLVLPVTINGHELRRVMRV